MLSHNRNTLITGGNFTNIHSGGSLSAFERLEKATATAGFHDSLERSNPPRCHPRTRLAILARLSTWIARQDNPNAYLMWLTGDAGAGKSAIAQTIADQCHDEGRLAASFFFGRSDSDRNDGRKLIATIAYQICTNIPGIRAFIEDAIDHDPLIFSKSLAVQMKTLVTGPLRQLQATGNMDTTAIYLIIVDGLDECHGRDIQYNILNAFSDAIHVDLPLLYLVASRTESHIVATFNSRKFTTAHTRHVLDEDISPDQDIELFLRDSFDEIKEMHPLKSFIPANWPSEDAILFLVSKASGQFIYASVAVKYLHSRRRRPTDCLDIILGLRPSLNEAPFAQLDMLYKCILEDVDDIDTAMTIVSLLILGHTGIMGALSIEYFLGLAPGDLHLHLESLASIIRLGDGQDAPRITHASFEDFLQDKRRSCQYFIDPPSRHHALALRCFQILRQAPRLDVEFSPEIISYTRVYAQFSLQRHCFHSMHTSELRQHITEFSIIHLKALLAENHDLVYHWYLWGFICSVKTMNFEDCHTISNRLLQDMRALVTEEMEIYYTNIELTALLPYLGRSRPNYGPYAKLIGDAFPWTTTDEFPELKHLDLLSVSSYLITPNTSRYYYYLHSVLLGCIQEREINNVHPMDLGKYTVASAHLLSYLSSRLFRLKSLTHSHYSFHDLGILAHYPWKWRQKKFGIHGSLTSRRLRRWNLRRFKLSDTFSPQITEFVNTNTIRHGYDGHWDTWDLYEESIKHLVIFLDRSDYYEELYHLADSIVFPPRGLIRYKTYKLAVVAVKRYLHRHASVHVLPEVDVD